MPKLKWNVKIKKLLILLIPLLCVNCTSSYSQKWNSKLQHSFFKYIFADDSVRLSMRTAKWCNADFNCYTKYLALDGRLNIIDSMVRTWKVDSYELLGQLNIDSFWAIDEFPNKTKLLDDTVFKLLAGANTKCNCPFKTDLSAISKPVFSEDSRFAVLKVDYSMSKWSSNTCQNQYLYFIRKENKWEKIGSRGCNCMIE